MKQHRTLYVVVESSVATFPAGLDLELSDLSIYLSTYLSIYLSGIYLSIYLSISRTVAAGGPRP